MMDYATLFRQYANTNPGGTSMGPAPPSPVAGFGSPLSSVMGNSGAGSAAAMDPFMKMIMQSLGSTSGGGMMDPASRGMPMRQATPNTGLGGLLGSSGGGLQNILQMIMKGLGGGMGGGGSMLGSLGGGSGMSQRAYPNSGGASFM